MKYLKAAMILMVLSVPGARAGYSDDEPVFHITTVGYSVIKSFTSPKNAYCIVAVTEDRVVAMQCDFSKMKR